MQKYSAVIAVRLVIGGITLLAIIMQAVFLQQQGVLNLVNYLSYFTNLSNVLAATIFIFSAFYLARNRAPSLKDDLIRGAATLYMIITGLVYLTLLINEDLGLLMPWVNIVTHIIMPLAAISDWLYRPPRNSLRSSQIFLWLIFPCLYLIYTLVRGAVVGWYPYPFLIPNGNDYSVVAVYCAAILAAFFVVGWLLVLTGKMRRTTASQK
ncbi:MAG TPA: Pr6Pr family membrane protein [Verrucomicrobiae bacterium]|nr:Pr6Pr family membrane protein [Verrucomicrobiae bacterium]